MLQPSSDLATVDKSKHKFMVQSMFAPADFSPDNLDQLVRGEGGREREGEEREGGGEGGRGGRGGGGGWEEEGGGEGGGGEKIGGIEVRR